MTPILLGWRFALKLSVFIGRGVEQLAARRAHNPKVTGSSPVPATKQQIVGPFFGVGFLLSGVHYGMGQRGIFQILDAGAAGHRLRCLPLAIRQGCLCGRHQVDSLGVGGALCLLGVDCAVVLRGQATAGTRRGHPVGVFGLHDQGRRGVAREGLGRLSFCAFLPELPRSRVASVN